MITNEQKFSKNLELIQTHGHCLLKKKKKTLLEKEPFFQFNFQIDCTTKWPLDNKDNKRAHLDAERLVLSALIVTST